MPKTREEIRHDLIAQGTWVSPHFGDGGSHTQPGVLWFDPREMLPMGDHVLLEIDAESDGDRLVVMPQAADRDRGTRLGTVLKVGPGKWLERRFKRKPMVLKPGNRVVIGPYSDWESWDAWAPGPNIVLCQEADVRLVLE